MLWTPVGEISISRQWSYSPIVEGEYFRLKHKGVPGVGSYFYIAQATVADETTYLLDIESVDVVSEEQLLLLPKPEVFKDRVLAFRRGYPPDSVAEELRNVVSPVFLKKQSQFNLGNRLLAWTITIEVGDFTGSRFIDAGTY